MKNRDVQILLHCEVLFSRVTLFHQPDCLLIVRPQALADGYHCVSGDDDSRHENKHKSGPIKWYSHSLPLTFAILRNQGSAPRAVFIRPIFRNPEATFGAWALVDALLYHKVSDQQNADD